GRHRAGHAVIGDRTRDHEPVRAQVRLAALDRHLGDTGVRQLGDEVERLLGGQLVVALVTRARSAMTAGEVALERQLPHGVCRARPTYRGVADRHGAPRTWISRPWTNPSAGPGWAAAAPGRSAAGRRSASPAWRHRRSRSCHGWSRPDDRSRTCA